MKAKIIIFVLLGFVLFSCSKKQNTDGDNIRDKIVQKSSGDKNEVVLVIEDKLWEGKHGEIIIEIFEKEIYGLDPSEKLFNLIQINPNEFSKRYQKNKNIIYVSSDVKDSNIKNKWVKNQIVMYLNSNSEEMSFRESCRGAISFLNQNELENIKNDYEINHNKKARLYVEEQFGFELFLPLEYRWVQEKEGLFVADVHLTSKKRDILKYIIIHEFQSINNNLKDEIISRTNDVLKEHIEGKQKGSYVQINNEIPLIEDNGIYRGMWRLKNGFMAGSLIIKPRYIEDKVIVSIGIVFDPSESNRYYVRTFEAIL